MRAAQLSYTNALIHVEIVQASDLQKAPAAATGDQAFYQLYSTQDGKTMHP